MASVASVSHGASYGERALEQHGSVLPTNGNTVTFAAFLDKFTEGSWPLSDTAEMRSVSSFSDADHRCQRGCSEIVETTTKAVTSIVTEEDSPYQAPKHGSNFMRARPSGSAETCIDSCSVDDAKDETAAGTSRAFDEISRSRVAFHSSVRKITNATNLRRMHISREDAVGLFPEVAHSVESVFKTKMTRREYSAPWKNGTLVCIYDVEGRRWPVMLECLRTAGQRHIRFNKGWAEMCSANGLSLGKCVRLDRWKQGSSSRDALVTVSVV